LTGPAVKDPTASRWLFCHRGNSRFTAWNN